MKSQESKIAVLEMQVKDIKNEVSELHIETKDGFKRLEDKLDCYVTKIQYISDMKRLNEKVGGNSKNWDWLIKTVMGIVIGALLAKLYL